MTVMTEMTVETTLNELGKTRKETDSRSRKLFAVELVMAASHRRLQVQYTLVVQSGPQSVTLTSNRCKTGRHL